jgi:hypothetical protein
MRDKGIESLFLLGWFVISFVMSIGWVLGVARRFLLEMGVEVVSTW